MKFMAVICNIVLFGFTCMVLVTDGPPERTAYVVFTVWSLLTLVLSAVAISCGGTGVGRRGPHMKKGASGEHKEIGDASFTVRVMRIAAIICNVVFFGFVCWALVDQYPHPKEDGLVAFVVLMISTPILNLAALFTSSRSGHPGP